MEKGMEVEEESLKAGEVKKTMMLEEHNSIGIQGKNVHQAFVSVYTCGWCSLLHTSHI